MEARMTDDAMSPGTMCCAVSFRILEIVPKPEGKEKYVLFSDHNGSHGGAGGGVGAEVFCLANASMALAMSAHTPWVQFSVSCECMLAHRTRV